jgi:peptidoglycan hydrolase-like protein with peptidoglycan-binding domain
MKKVIRLSESDLVRLIKKIINEGNTYPDDWDAIIDLVMKEPLYNLCNIAGGRVVIGKGNQGPLVAFWQLVMNIEKKQGDLKSSVQEDLVLDGIFGDKTKELTIEFQKNNGLTPDGIVGGRTFNHIGMAGYNTKDQFRKNCKFEPPSYMFN